MEILNKQQFNGKIQSIKGHAGKMREDVQQALLSAAYFNLKDNGNTDPFNRILEAVGASTRREGIIRWAEMFGGARLKNDKLVANKKAIQESHIVDAESFNKYLDSIEGRVYWCDVAGKENTPSIFDEGRFMNSVYAKLDRQGYMGLSEALKMAELAYLAKMKQSVTKQEEETEDA